MELCLFWVRRLSISSAIFFGFDIVKMEKLRVLGLKSPLQKRYNLIFVVFIGVYRPIFFENVQRLKEEL